MKLFVKSYYFIFILILLFISADVTAKDSLNGNAGLSYYYNKDDESNVSMIYGLWGTYYLNPVSGNSYPWVEASFFERVSNLSVSLDYSDHDSGDTGLKSDIPGYGVSGKWASNKNSFYFLLSYDHYSLERTGQQNIRRNTATKRDSYALTFGGFTSKNAALAINYQRNDYTYSYQFREYDDDTVERLRLYFKGIHSLEKNKAYAFYGSFTMDQEKEDDGKTYRGQSVYIHNTFYPDPKTGISGSLRARFTDREIYEGFRLALEYQSFIGDHFAYSIYASQFMASNSEGTDDNSVSTAFSYWY